MIRTLFSSPQECPLNCLYCFARMDEYKKLDMFNVDNLNNGAEIIYPSCDSELVFDDAFFKMIDDITTMSQYKIFSFSTKRTLSLSVIKRLQELNRRMILGKKGFIKVNVSITNKMRIGELEPSSASYEDRLETLHRLNQFNVPNSVIIKPILPFIKDEEYINIINDTSSLTEYYTLGGLYFSQESNFYKSYLTEYEYEDRAVSWLGYKPYWKYISYDNRSEVLKAIIKNNGCKYFESDKDMIDDMFERYI